MKVFCVTILVVLFYQGHCARSRARVAPSQLWSTGSINPPDSKSEAPFDSVLYFSSPAINQLVNYAAANPNDTKAFGQTAFGIVYPTLTASLKIGTRGPLLLQDSFLHEKLRRFAKERIPERVAHARGTGALGFFEVTNDISRYTIANFLQPGKRTKVAARLSTTTDELGSADTNTNTKGFAVKFYTEEGNHDLLSLNIIGFFTRDPMRFADSTKSRRRNPQTNLPDYIATTDFQASQPEIAMFVLSVMSSTATPKSFRCMRSYALNTFTMVNAKGEGVYVKFHWIPHQKEESFSHKEAAEMRALYPDHYVQDLYDSIAKGDFPKWTLYIQMMTESMADRQQVNPFDPTIFWNDVDFPLHPVGTLTLNENVKDHFADVEQIAFTPANMVPGIEASPDIILQSRLFSYNDAQRHRLGLNYEQLPINRCPFTKTYSRDGAMNIGDNGENSPGFYPNSFHGLNSNNGEKYQRRGYYVRGYTNRDDNMYVEDNFKQPKYYFEEMINDLERKTIITNMIGYYKKVPKDLQLRILRNLLYPISKILGDGVKAGLKL